MNETGRSAMLRFPSIGIAQGVCHVSFGWSIAMDGHRVNASAARESASSHGARLVELRDGRRPILRDHHGSHAARHPAA